MEWVPHKPETWPYRYGELKQGVMAHRYLGGWKDGEPMTDDYLIPEGTTVKIVMVSRFGDVGITDRLEDERNYVSRVTREFLVNLRAEP